MDAHGGIYTRGMKRERTALQPTGKYTHLSTGALIFLLKNSIPAVIVSATAQWVNAPGGTHAWDRRQTRGRHNEGVGTHASIMPE